MTVYFVLNQLVRKAISLKMIESDDEIYARNQIMSLIGLTDFPEHPESNPRDSYNPALQDTSDLLDKLVDAAVKAGVIEDLFDEKEILSSKIMNVFIDKPSLVNKSFYQKWAVNPVEATDYFYELSEQSNYIQTKRIANNISYKAETPYGELDITINLSKPEKDPKEIAREKERKAASTANYPKCLLCVENEGYAGRIGHPARSNHRMIRLELTEEPWFFQYSPYSYYNEHCIVLSGEHRDMAITKDTFKRLIEFVEKFPHYFIGSNADLPIVGGSILTHDHYQGGNYTFAMAKAPDDQVFHIPDYPGVRAATVKWPMSVIRLRAKEQAELLNACAFILEKWTRYSDEAANIIAYTGETRHNTITPIVRMRNGELEADLVLRNNRTTDEHRLGIFHPHSDVHHIKKENIGLIEVMGLAVLPARLKTELQEVEKFLLDESNQIADYHTPWANEMNIRYAGKITAETVTDIVQKEVGYKFLRVLEDAGVFKRSEEGQKAFQRFIHSLV
jgi:UDPglucose--hexose-1-phosphate uridylyltransferase